MAIVATIAALALIIVVHELGHFAVAKWLRIPVEEFSLGWGVPILVRLKRGETEYTLRPVLIGGFVRIAGMEPDSTAENGFDKRPAGQRFAVIAAGSTMNLVIAVVVFCLLGLVVGKTVGSTNIVDRVLHDRPAAAAGLEPGDRIVAVNAVSGGWEQMREEIRSHPGTRIRITVEREGKRLVVPMVPEPTKEPQITGTAAKPKYSEVTVGQIGIVTRPITERMGIGESLSHGVGQAVGVVQLLSEGLFWTVTGRLPANKMFGGPVRVVGEVSQGWELGWEWFVRIAAMLSFQIGIINLFPIPGLDGSRVAFLAIEAVRRKPLDRRKEAMVHAVGIVLLIAAILVLTYNDILYYVTKQ